MTISDKIRNNGFVKFLSALEPIGVAVGLIGLSIAGYAFLQDFENRKEERIARAWELLSIKIPGNSGKSDALNILHGYGINLSDVDLSCETLGGKLHDKTVTISHFAASEDYAEGFTSPCIGSPRLNDLDFSIVIPNWKNFWTSRSQLIAENIQLEGMTGENLNFSDSTIQGANLDYSTVSNFILRNGNAEGISASFSNMPAADFSGAELTNANFSRSDLSYASFANTTAVCADFSGSNLEGIDFQEDALFSGSSFFMARLTNSKINNDIAQNSDLSFANVSGAYFEGEVSKREDLFGQMWAWSDNLPKPAEVVDKLDIKICEPFKEGDHEDFQSYLGFYGQFQGLTWELVPQSCGIVPEEDTVKFNALAAPEICAE